MLVKFFNSPPITFNRLLNLPPMRGERKTKSFVKEYQYQVTCTKKILKNS